jgi:hypothetical protein
VYSTTPGSPGASVNVPACPTPPLGSCSGYCADDTRGALLTENEYWWWREARPSAPRLCT